MGEARDWLDWYLDRLRNASTAAEEVTAVEALLHVVPFQAATTNEELAAEIARRCDALCVAHCFHLVETRVRLCGLGVEMRPLPSLDTVGPTPEARASTPYKVCLAVLFTHGDQTAFDAALASSQRMNTQWSDSSDQHVRYAVRSLDKASLRVVWNRYSMDCLRREWLNVEVSPRTMVTLCAETVPSAVQVTWAELFRDGYRPWVHRPTTRILGVLPNGTTVEGAVRRRVGNRLGIRTQRSSAIVLPMLWTFAYPFVQSADSSGTIDPIESLTTTPTRKSLTLSAETSREWVPSPSSSSFA